MAKTRVAKRWAWRRFAPRRGPWDEGRDPVVWEEKGLRAGAKKREEKGKAHARSLRTQEKRQSAQKEGEKQLGEGNDGMSGDAAERDQGSAWCSSNLTDFK